MTRGQERNATENPYKKIFDDAGRSLRGFGDSEILDELPESSEHGTATVPFPYGPQPKSRKHWE